MIKDKLQGSVAKYLRSGGLVNNQITKGLLLSLPVNFFLNRWIFGKVTRKPGHYTAKSRRKCITQSTFLPVTMPNIYRFQKNFTGNKPCLIWLLIIPPHLKYVSTALCNLSLTAALICDCCSFSGISVSQGSVATHMRRGGIFNKNFAANLLENQKVKKFWKSAETNYRCEFGPRCIYGILSQVTSGKWLQVNSALHPSGVAKSSTSFDWGKGGNVTSAGWQVTLCDPMWHVSSRSSVATLRTAIHLLLTYLLAVSCSSKIQIGFTFLVPAYPGSPGQRAVKRVCVCVCVCVIMIQIFSLWVSRQLSHRRRKAVTWIHPRIFLSKQRLSTTTSLNKF